MKALVLGDKRDTALRLAVLRAMFTAGIAGMSARKPIFRRARPKNWRRIFQHMSIEPQAKIFKVLKITSGLRHAWVESDKGVIRKPIWTIPTEIVTEYHFTKGVCADGKKV